MKKAKTLNPYDSELLLMIESVTGGRPIVNLYKDFYTIEIRTKGLPIKIKKAVADAIDGRLFGRVKGITFKEEFLLYTVEYGEDCGEIIESERMTDGDISDSNFFYVPETTLRGLMVLPTNFERLVRFVGNGSWERRPDGNDIFHFLNASGTVFCDAPEGSFLIYVKPGLYRVATKEEMSKFAIL